MKFIVGDKWERQAYKLRKYLYDIFGSAYKSVGYFVGGGAVRSVFAGEPVKDLDLFFFNQDYYETIKEKFVSKGELTFSFGTDNAETYWTKNGRQVQFIKRVLGGAGEVLKSFDFTISMGAYVPNGDFFVLEEMFLYHLSERRLVFNIDAKYPIASLWRMKKFIRRGYKIGARDLIALALRVHSLEFSTFADLKEQLDGIDTYLLKDLTDKLVGEKDTEYDYHRFICYIDEKIEDIWGKEEGKES